MRNAEKKRPEVLERETARDFGRALSEGLNVPLSALRASMESLTDELSRGSVGPLLIDGVLREVDRLGRNVRDLVDFATPPVVRPLRCTLEEIVDGARRQLNGAKSRVIIAHERSGGSMVVDGPLLATCLRRLIENAVEASSEHVLVVTRQEQGSTSFSVLDDGHEALDLDWARTAFHSTKPNHMGLGIALTERDVVSMGGTLEFLTSPTGGKLARLTVPDSTPDSTPDSAEDRR